MLNRIVSDRTYIAKSKYIRCCYYQHRINAKAEHDDDKSAKRPFHWSHFGFLIPSQHFHCAEAASGKKCDEKRKKSRPRQMMMN